MKKNNWKRYGALAAVVLILIAFCLPMIFAFGKSEQSQALFRGSLGVALLAPVLLYAMMLVYRILNKPEKPEESEMENIIFDVGQVLVKFDWKTYLDSFGFEKEKAEKIAKVVFLSDTWNERDRGTLSEKDYVDQMVQKLPEYEDDIREIMRRSYETISQTDYAETWVKYLKNKGYHIYILSNYCEEMLKMTRTDLTFLRYADGEVFSCEAKQIKPEPEIYQTLISRYHLDPKKSVFLDDRKENCEAAEKAGIHTIQFTSFKQAAAELEKLGVK